MPLKPLPGSPDELAQFSLLQQRLPELYQKVASNERYEHTVVVVPSLSMDPRELTKISGVHHYEERLLFFLMLLRRPKTRVIYVTSQAISNPVVDYYLHLLSGVPTSHARQRLTLLDCYDASNRPLTQKILERPRLMNRLRQNIGDPKRAHMVCFNSSVLERTLAVQLQIPLYANDPANQDLGPKAGAEKFFEMPGFVSPVDLNA